MSENPYRVLCDFAMRMIEEEAALFDQQAGRPRNPGEWGPRFHEAETRLNDFVNAGLVAADRTGFPVQEVEQRLNNLASAVTAVLLWQRDA